MNRVEVPINKGEATFYEGYKITSIMPEAKPPIVLQGKTVHEAKHVVAAELNGTAVQSATIIAGVGYEGLTILSKPDAVAALAPHATGESGTGHDVMIAELIGSAGAESAARGIINSNMDKVMAVAEVLEEKRTIGSTDIKKAIKEVDSPPPIFATVFVETPDGHSKKLSGLEVKDGAINLGEVLVFQAKKEESEDLAA